MPRRYRQGPIRIEDLGQRHYRRRRSALFISLAVIASFLVILALTVTARPARSSGSDNYKPTASAEVIEVPYWKCNGTAKTNAAGCEEAYPSGVEPSTKKVRLNTWEKYSCSFLRDYLATHTEEQAREEAKRLHFPQWLIHRAERCPR